MLLLTGAGCSGGEAEEPDPMRRKSPTAIASASHGNTYIKIVYGQPYKQGRDIFGELVPYGEVWRTGANEATELTTTGDLLFNGRKIEAGTYALFTIPGRERWTVILNSELGQWGAFEYESTKDVLRTEVSSYKTQQLAEVFTIRFAEIEGNETALVMSWDSTRVEIPIRFTDSGPVSPSHP